MEVTAKSFWHLAHYGVWNMDVELYLSNANLAATTGNVEEARALLKQVLDYDPQNVRAWSLLADAVSSSKHAMRCLEKVLKLDPKNEQARQKLAMYQLDEKSADRHNGQEAWIDDAFEDPAAVSSGEEPWSYEAYTAKKQAAEDALRAELPPDESPRKRRWGWEAALIAVLGVTAVCLLVVLLIPGLSLLSPTGGAAAQPETAVEDVTDVIIQNIIASNNEDFDRYMATIHSKSPGYEATAQMLSTIFGDYDLTYQISELEVVEQTSREAQVNFVLTTRKVRGPEFQDNQVSGRMILKKDNGAWKIYDQKIENVQYLD
jgi:tetratricopeptide (TPR) repeat protein